MYVTKVAKATGVMPDTSPIGSGDLVPNQLIYGKEQQIALPYSDSGLER
ncbi:MAG: hypothetical protein IIB74_09385 [Proteobacteria bacterium]|nr:hypothetical protein [Pseudomonadota bacterium]